jgi:carboxylesterase type B
MRARRRFTGVLDAANFGKSCPQTPAVVDPDASEDCLFLNVYVRRDRRTPRNTDQQPDTL